MTIKGNIDEVAGRYEVLDTVREKRRARREQDRWVSITKTAASEYITREIAMECMKSHVYARRILAENRHVPLDLLAILAEDADNLVRYNLARNPAISVGILEKLASDSTVQVRRAVKSHPKTPLWLKMSVTMEGV